MTDFNWPVSPTLHLTARRSVSDKVDCYVSGPCDLALFLPIARALREHGADARLVLEPPVRNTAMAHMANKDEAYRVDASGEPTPLMTPEAYARCVAWLEQEGEDWEDRARPDADAALTTGVVDTLRRYTGVKIKVTDGMGFGRDDAAAGESCSGFDAAMTSGPIGAARLRRFFAQEDVHVVGLPKYAPVFRRKMDCMQARANLGVNPGKPMLVYFPTWADHCGLETVAPALSAMTDKYAVYCKPHSHTALFERERIESLAGYGGVQIVEDESLTPSLLLAADMVLADAHGGIAAESIWLGKNTLLLTPDARSAEGLLDGAASAFSVCHDPEQLRDIIEKQFSGRGTPEGGRAWMDLFYTSQKDNDDETAAEAVRQTLRRKARPWTGLSDMRFDGRLAEELLFSIIVPTYNRCDILKDCLNALDAQTFPKDRFEVLVCDDGSTGDTQQFMTTRTSDMPLTYLRQENHGPAAARNMGLKAARGRFVLMLNDDAIAAPDLLENHYKAHLLHPDARQAVLGSFSFPEMYRETLLGYLLEEGGYLFAFNKRMRPHQRHDYAHFYTCNISLSRAFLEAVSGFDEEFNLPAGEDVELGRRLQMKQQCYVFHAPECVTRHEHPQTIEMFCRTQYMRGLAQPLLYVKHPDVLNYIDQEHANSIMRYQLKVLDASRVQLLVDKFKALEAPHLGDTMTRGKLGRIQFHKTACAMATPLKIISDYYFIKGQLESPHMGRLVQILNDRKNSVAALENA